MIRKKGRLNFLVVAVLIAVNILFAYFYNTSVRRVVAQVAHNDYISLQSQNDIIIDRLKAEKDMSSWESILGEYQENIMIFDKFGQVVAKSESSKFSPIDSKVRTPFEYKGEAYLIRSSVYLLRDYIKNPKGVTLFVIVEILLVLMALTIFVLIVYGFLVRPFRMIYNAIEEYDHNGTIMELKLKGFAGRVYRRFYIMAKKVEGQQMNQRRIIASISHDIKTPLTSIMGYSEQLKKGNLSEERRQRYLSTVYDKAVDIHNLVDEFDEYLESNLAYGINKTVISVDKIEQCIMKDYSDDFVQAEIDFKIINRADKDAEILADSQRLKRVFNNILTNSIKHFKGEEKKIRLLITSDYETVRFKFSDNGEGVPEEKMGMIFEPLYTSDEGRKVAGLGLAICREIVEVHNGIIYAEKSDMGGLAVCIELPRE